MRENGPERKRRSWRRGERSRQPWAGKQRSENWSWRARVWSRTETTARWCLRRYVATRPSTRRQSQRWSRRTSRPSCRSTASTRGCCRRMRLNAASRWWRTPSTLQGQPWYDSEGLEFRKTGRMACWVVENAELGKRSGATHVVGSFTGMQYGLASKQLLAMAQSSLISFFFRPKENCFFFAS